MKKRTPKLYPQDAEEQPQTVNEPEVAYGTTSVETNSTRHSYSKGVVEPAEFTAEEFADLIAEAEAGPFYTLEEIEKDFDIWEKEFLKNHGIIQ